MLLTWRVGTGTVIHKVKVSKIGCSDIRKASPTIILVATSKEIIIVEHDKGNNLVVNKRCKLARPREFTSSRAEYIYGNRALNDKFVVIVEWNIQVWNFSTGKLIRTIENGKNCRVVVSDDLMMIGGRDNQLYVYQIGDAYNLLKTIPLQISEETTDITFLNGDIVMVTALNSGIYFVSIESGQFISHYKLKDSNFFTRAAVMSDGRVCVGGLYGYCAIFKPPQEIEHFIADYTQRMNSSPGPSVSAGETNDKPNITQLRKEWRALDKRNKKKKVK